MESSEEGKKIASKKSQSIRFPFRMDFVIEDPKLVDKKKGHMEFRLVPDPRIWERVTKNGEDGYFNKTDNIFVPWSVLAKMIEELPGLPITYSPPPGFTGIGGYLGKSRRRLAKDAKET